MTQRSEVGAATRVTIGPNVYARAFGDEIVLLDFSRGEYFGLDEVGAEVWRGIERGSSLDEIAAWLVSRFDVTHAQALEDSIAMVGELIENGLVTPPPTENAGT